ncbi:MAG: MotB family protein [Parvibaculaceae bacterium]
MNAAAEGPPKELVIIRRRSSDDLAAPKGGVWKIAYADFMTAMMAFFLVMWLINAANEATRSQVASYFNPVKLVDTRTNTKGLQDLDTGTEGPVKQKTSGTPEQASGKSEQEKAEGLPLEAKKVEHTEQSLFQDPYVVLAQLAKEAGAGSDTDQKKTGVLAEQSGRPGLRGGEGYVDPFDPATWSTVTEAENPVSRPQSPDPTAKELSAEIAAATGAAREMPKSVETSEKAHEGSAEVLRKVADKAQVPPPQEKVAEVVKAKPAAEGDQPAAATGRTAKVAETAEKEAASLKSAVEKAAGEAGPGHAPLVDVKTTDEGVLLSLTDTSSFGMFDIASAKPRAELVRFMEKVAKALNERTGTIIIRGHTDGRPFRSETYDNWRLSAARAHMAYYMLVRGGIDEKRVERIEGHADRALKLPSDPEAAENRRIEILVRPAHT